MFEPQTNRVQQREVGSCWKRGVRGLNSPSSYPPPWRHMIDIHSVGSYPCFGRLWKVSLSPLRTLIIMRRSTTSSRVWESGNNVGIVEVGIVRDRPVDLQVDRAVERLPRIGFPGMGRVPIYRGTPRRDIYPRGKVPRRLISDNRRWISDSPRQITLHGWKDISERLRPLHPPWLLPA